MPEDYISRNEHTEFVKRMDDEHKRQNRRLEELEEAVKQYGALTISVEKLASSMQSMLEEQKAQGERLEELESRDGEMWRKVTGHGITAAISAVVGYIFSRLGM